jgi:hypothetical protein
MRRKFPRPLTEMGGFCHKCGLSRAAQRSQTRFLMTKGLRIEVFCGFGANSVVLQRAFYTMEIVRHRSTPEQEYIM